MASYRGTSHIELEQIARIWVFRSTSRRFGVGMRYEAALAKREFSLCAIQYIYVRGE